MIYADNAATTKLDARVLEKILPFLQEDYYNPSSLYYPSKQIREKIAGARHQVSKLLHCASDEVTFTASGTEANNLAILGAAYALKEKGRHLITSSIEHHSVLNSFKWLETCGFRVTYLPVDKAFMVDPLDFRDALEPDTILASVMLVNNEVGARQPIEELAALARAKGVLFHTDAVQAVGTEDIDLQRLNVDLLSLSGHKIYAPKGVGALFMRQGTPFTRIIHGGHQENGKRPGTENVMGIVGLGEACGILESERASRQLHVQKLKQRFLEELLGVEDLKINAGQTSVGSICSISVKNLDAETMLLMLSRKNILASMGAACDSTQLEPSHVLIAGAVDPEYLLGTIRFSFGMYNNEDEIRTIAQAFKCIVDELKTF
jgi:cysteine desulfurase